MKVLKKLFLVLGILGVGLLVAAFTIPYLFKDKIVVELQKVINEQVNANVRFSDVSLSLFRRFPNLDVRIHDLQVTGVAPFDGYPLAQATYASATVNLWKVISGNNITISSVELQDPKVQILVLADGTANYDIAKPAPETDTTTTDFQLELQEYKIANGSFLYTDQSLDMEIALLGLEHRGKGDLSLTVYDLDTESEIDSLSFSYGGMTYLKHVKTNLDAGFNIDTENSKYSLLQNKAVLNELPLALDGFVQLVGDSTVLDLKMDTPESDFKKLLSLIPNAYTKDFEDVKTSGKFTFASAAKGVYFSDSLRTIYPAFDIQLGIDNAMFKYPSLPLAISGIRAKADVKSPTQNPDDMKVNIPAFQMNVGKNPIAGRLLLTRPMSDPTVDGAVKGTLNLEELAKAFPMEGVERLRGLVKADIVAKASMSQIDAGRYQDVVMKGDASLQNIQYKSSGLPAVGVKTARMQFTPQQVVVPQFDITLGRSDLRGSASIQNVLAWFSPRQTMRGTLQAQSNTFDLNEWMESEETQSKGVTTSIVNPTPNTPVTETQNTAQIFDRFAFDLDLTANDIVYDTYHLKNTTAKGIFAPNHLDIASSSTTIMGSTLNAQGVLRDIFKYVFEGGVLGGELALQSDYLDLNKFMEEPAPSSGESSATTATSEYGVVPVPENMRMTIDATIGKLIYTNMELTNLKGIIAVADKKAILQDTRATTLGGQIALSGGYDTRDISNPVVDMKLDLLNLDFQQAYSTFNTFRMLAPIGKFISGKFNTSLILGSSLGSDLMPKLNSIDAEGFLETINGLVKGFKPLIAVGNLLGVDYLKEELSVVGTKNWFAVKDGFLEVKPFDYQLKDIKMRIQGKHSITLQDGMDYRIEATIPRALLEKNNVGQVASGAFKQLRSEAGKLGLSIDEAETVNVLISLTGSTATPKATMKLLGTDGKIVTTKTVAEDLKKQAQDEIKKEATQKAEELTNAAKEKAKTAVDSASKVISKEADRLKEQAKDKASEVIKDKAGTVADSLAKAKMEGALKNRIDSTAADSIKKKLDQWNPLKKKTKN